MTRWGISVFILLWCGAAEALTADRPLDLYSLEQESDLIALGELNSVQQIAHAKTAELIVETVIKGASPSLIQVEIPGWLLMGSKIFNGARFLAFLKTCSSACSSTVATHYIFYPLSTTSPDEQAAVASALVGPSPFVDLVKLDTTEALRALLAMSLASGNAVLIEDAVSAGVSRLFAEYSPELLVDVLHASGVVYSQDDKANLLGPFFEAVIGYSDGLALFGAFAQAPTLGSYLILAGLNSEREITRSSAASVGGNISGLPSFEIRAKLQTMALNEVSPIVLSQLEETFLRMADADSLEIIESRMLLEHNASPVEMPFVRLAQGLDPTPTRLTILWNAVTSEFLSERLASVEALGAIATSSDILSGDAEEILYQLDLAAEDVVLSKQIAAIGSLPPSQRKTDWFASVLMLDDIADWVRMEGAWQFLLDCPEIEEIETTLDYVPTSETRTLIETILDKWISNGEQDCGKE